jgi:hypothetical protein
VTLPYAGRALGRAVTAAVTGAVASDGPALREAVGSLVAADPHVVRSVLSTLVLRLLEQSAPDGLDAESVRGLLVAVLTDATGWLPELDPHAVVLVLGGALQVAEEDAPPAEWTALLTASALVVAQLLAGQPVGPELDVAFGELRREQTVELP